MMAVLTVADIREDSSKGVIIGGTNYDFNNLTKDEIRQRVGDKLQFHNPDGSIVESQVLDVDLSESIIGQKNIFLLIPAAEKGAIKNGAVVYRI